MTKEQKYGTNLTHEKIAFSKQFLPPSRGLGYWALDIGQVLNALFYVAVGGIAGRMPLTDLPPWKSVYHYFWQ